MTKREVRESLHPELDKQLLPNNNYFIPGYQTVNKMIKKQTGHKVIKKDKEVE